MGGCKADVTSHDNEQRRGVEWYREGVVVWGAQGGTEDYAH